MFDYYVTNPECFGVVEFDSTDMTLSIEEKVAFLKSNYVVTGLYFFIENCDLGKKKKHMFLRIYVR